MAQNRDSEYAMQVWNISEVYISGNIFISALWISTRGACRWVQPVHSGAVEQGSKRDAIKGGVRPIQFILPSSARKIVYLILNFKLLEKQPNLGEEEVQKSFERLEQIYTEKVSALLKSGSVWSMPQDVS